MLGKELLYKFGNLYIHSCAIDISVENRVTSLLRFGHSLTTLAIAAIVSLTFRFLQNGIKTPYLTGFEFELSSQTRRQLRLKSLVQPTISIIAVDRKKWSHTFPKESECSDLEWNSNSVQLVNRYNTCTSKVDKRRTK